VGKTRKCRARENGGGAGREKNGKGRPPPSPQFPPFYFLVRAFSIPRARLSRSLEKAKNIDELNQTCLGGL